MLKLKSAIIKTVALEANSPRYTHLTLAQLPSSSYSFLAIVPRGNEYFA